jgi:uridine phosphorylase
MSFPNFENKHAQPAIVTAAEWLKHRRVALAERLTPLHSVIFCYQSSLIEYARRHYAARQEQGLLGHLYRLEKTSGHTALACDFGIGAPVVAALTEQLAALGARRIVSIGLAGGLQPGLRAGDIVVCERAIRDEGTSHHYLPASKYAAASETMTAALCRALDAQGQLYTIGASWTTDAPFRETRAEIEQYRAEGVAAVDMEASALFTVGACLRIAVGAAFVIGDTYAHERWQFDFDARAAERRLNRLLDAAVIALERLDPE